MNNRYDVIGVGNAIVDILSHCEEEFFARENLAKGGMTLIDEARADALYALLPPATECSGGSAANTLAGLASLGARTAFIGKVRDDQLGAIFRHDMRAGGTRFDTEAAESGPGTARCLVFVTKDGERTMATYLGACGNVRESDIEKDAIAAAAITYIEGYLWDQPETKTAIRAAIDAAKSAGRKVAFTLSDTFCVERHRAEFEELLKGSIDLLFANEAELLALTRADGLEEGLRALRGACELAAITRSEQGCIVLHGSETLHVPTKPVAGVVDTTGAGDLFAAGFLYGYTQGWEAKRSATLGNACAGRIIQQLGARAQAPLGDLVGISAAA